MDNGDNVHPPGDDDWVDVEAGHGGGGQDNGDAQQQMLQMLQMQMVQQQQLIQQLMSNQQPASHRTTTAGGEKVKLPAFWDKDAGAWFTLAEEILTANNIVDQRAKYRAVLLVIPHHILERTRGVLNAASAAADPYKELKDRLVELLTPSKLDQINSIIWGAELGGRRPSEMMDGMLASLPPGEQAGLLFKGHFLHRLPTDIKNLVAVQFANMQAKELAVYADSIWDARNAKKATVAAVQTPTGDAEGESTLDKAVAALSLQKQPKRGGRGWRGNRGGNRGGNSNGGQNNGGGSQGSGGGGQGSGNRGGKYLCSKHLRFGDQTWACEEPQSCQWTGN